MRTPAGRDEGYRRIRAVTRWVTAGSLAAVAAVAAAVGLSIPGHASTSTSARAANTPTTSRSSPTAKGPAFRAPSEAPVATNESPVASSGAS